MIASLGVKQIIGIIAAFVLIAGVGVGVYLVQRQQTIKSRATGENFVTAFELKDKDGHTILCDTSKNPPECTTRTLDINVRVATTSPLLP